MDFTKFVSLIDKSSLFFARADTFKDPFEGSYPRINVEARKSIFNTVEDKKSIPKKMVSLSTIYVLWPRYTAINCWHVNEYESAAMWNLYLKTNKGIAIRTTYNLLKESIVDKEDVHLGLVKYIDYNKEYINANNCFEPFVHKRKSFEHEREIRAIVGKNPSDDNGIDFSIENIDSGLYIKVDLNVLISQIIVAPDSPKWFKELVSSILNKYGFYYTIGQSMLNEGPLF